MDFYITKIDTNTSFHHPKGYPGVRSMTLTIEASGYDEELLKLRGKKIRIFLDDEEEIPAPRPQTNTLDDPQPPGIHDLLLTNRL